MEKSFANLLRHSRLASYDRTLEQVYTAPKRFRKTGDWGLKRNLPTVIRTKFVEVGGLDTSEHQTPWQSGNSKVLFVKRWKENFPNSKKPTPRSDQVQYNAANMTPAEFQRLMRKSQKKAADFQDKLAKKELIPEQVYDYLHVSFAETTESNGENVVGPTYSDHQVDWDYPVQGRILNSHRNGYSIGIGGVVAHMNKRDALGLRMVDRSVRDFYVRNVEFDEQGKPKVEVALQPKNAASAVPILHNYDGYEQHPDFAYKPRSGQDMSVQEMMNKRPHAEDNSRPNPEHQELMARISSLLNNSKEN